VSKSAGVSGLRKRELPLFDRFYRGHKCWQESDGSKPTARKGWNVSRLETKAEAAKQSSCFRTPGNCAKCCFGSQNGHLQFGQNAPQGWYSVLRPLGLPWPSARDEAKAIGVGGTTIMVVTGLLTTRSQTTQLCHLDAPDPRLATRNHPCSQPALVPSTPRAIFRPTACIYRL